MGYYTYYDISENSEEVQQAIEEKSQYSFHCGRTGAVKWYAWKDDCLAVSRIFPEELIYLEGDGEEQGDQWKAYFKNGKAQVSKAVITFEPFDESKLK